MTARTLLVSLSDGTKHRVRGVARWTEPPMFPSDAPHVLKNSEIEITQEEAQDIRKRAQAALKAGEPLVFGCDWDYEPAVSGSMFLEAYDKDGVKIASFNPMQVDSAYFEDAGEEVEDD